MSSNLMRNAAVAALMALPTLGMAEMVIDDPYARVSRPNAPTGAAFMVIRNTGETEDRLVAASSAAAKRVELHTHVDQGDGVMKMTELEDGITIAAGESHMLMRGGDHVMFMGLVEPLEQDMTISVTLTFEQAGDVVVTIPVDNQRKPNHGSMEHMHMDQNATN